MTDAGLLVELVAASPTFGTQWRLIADTYPESNPATFSDALFDFSGYLLGLVSKDRRHEVGPVLAALERCYQAGSPSQRDEIRGCVLQLLHEACNEGGLDPAVFLVHLGPQCRAAWAELDGT